MVEQRGIASRIYQMTEQAITTQVEVCDVERIQGIKVEHCVRTVAQ